MEHKEYQLNPIGSIYKKDNQQIVEITKAYIKCLKYLSMFGHATVIYRDETQYNIWNTRLSQTVVTLISVDEKTGILITSDVSDGRQPLTLYDMKPYFPGEDRVKDAKSPNSVFKITDTDSSDNRKLAPFGMIHKQKGNYYLEFYTWSDNCVTMLNNYSHVKIIWWFHKFDKPQYRKVFQCNPPYENAPKTGIFATRSPVRPNPIAMTTAKIISIDEKQKRVYVSKLDSFDNTPFIGISPYIPALDFTDDYKLPPWLSHWSKWVDDREFSDTNDILIKDSAVDRLNLYKCLDRKPAESNTGYFEQTKTQDAITSNEIVITGARQNNLKNINVTLPYGNITVLTGVSGSGKSSLAFDTIFAESQQRFLSSMSLLTRSQSALLEKPAFDRITGLPPAIAITQQHVNKNPRSTVGTSTNLYDLLRTLFSCMGTRHCPECGNAVIKMSVDEIVFYLQNCLPGTELDIRPYQSADTGHTIFVPSSVKDAIFLEELKSTVETYLLMGQGAITVNLSKGESIILQITETCYSCDKILFELTPTDFSFNHSESMCPVCKGLGYIMDVDTSRIVANPEISILDGASSFWGRLRQFLKSPNANWMKGQVLALASEMKVDLEKPWNCLPEEFKTLAIYGSNEKEVSFQYENKNGRSGTITRPLEGVYHIIKRLYESNDSAGIQENLLSFMTERECDCCHGERLKRESRMVTVAGTRFPLTARMTLEELQKWIITLPGELDPTDAEKARPILQELHSKLANYIEIGLGYLTLNRTMPTLSGGEQQRLLLVSQLSSGISNILYVLDEPTTGLHPKDYKSLMNIVKRLKSLTNTILIVEHSPAIMLEADKIIDFGSLAGEHGGYIAAEGTPEQIMENRESETGLYLSGKKKLTMERQGRICDKTAWIGITGIYGNNLRDISIKFPVNALTCITGVSGSGKSTLVKNGIFPAIQFCIQNTIPAGQMYKTILGAEHFEKLISITQTPIGRSSRSTPATYTGIMDELRLMYSKTTEARARKFTLSNFSYNSKEGQCSACHGYGYQSLDTPFMPYTKTVCPICRGKKFNAKTLEITYRDNNISEILEMNAETALDFFRDHKKISEILQIFVEVGLGYLKLGQDSQTLSGGEAQRVKLANELSQNHAANTFYLLDEPTTGLAFSDIQNLLNIFSKIIDKGNTIVLVEHNMSVIKHADWIIDLGPEGGTNGGNVMIQDIPEHVAECEDSHTGKLLKYQGI